MKILDRLPFSETRSEVWAPDRLATVKPYQIIVTVSLAVREMIEPDPGLPRFPAILDTGKDTGLVLSPAPTIDDHESRNLRRSRTDLSTHCLVFSTRDATGAAGWHRAVDLSGRFRGHCRVADGTGGRRRSRPTLSALRPRCLQSWVPPAARQASRSR